MTIHRKLKTFIRTTNSGGVQKIVREHYVRDDIPCGHPSCGACSLEEGRARLCERPTLSSVLCPFPHFIIPDTNVIVAAVVQFIIYTFKLTEYGHFGSWQLRSIYGHL